jgi:hypothetical protein
MPRLLNCLLITLRRLTIPNKLLTPLPPLPKSSQLSRQNERDREVHLDICHSELVAEQELAVALLELRIHEIQIVLDVLRQSDLGLLGIAGLLVPASVQDGDGVESISGFCGVDPLQYRVTLGVADCWQQAVGGVVRVAEVSFGRKHKSQWSFWEGSSEYSATYSAIFPLSVIVTPLSTSVGNFPSPPASFLNSGGARPPTRGENLTS